MSAPRPLLVEALPAQHPLAAWREIDGLVVIISPQDSVLHELNATGSFIWKHLDGARKPEEIARMLAEEFDVSVEQAEKDTREFLLSLAGKNLLARPEEVARG